MRRMPVRCGAVFLGLALLDNEVNEFFSSVGVFARNEEVNLGWCRFSASEIETDGG